MAENEEDSYTRTLRMLRETGALATESVTRVINRAKEYASISRMFSPRMKPKLKPVYSPEESREREKLRGTLGELDKYNPEDSKGPGLLKKMAPYAERMFGKKPEEGKLSDYAELKDTLGEEERKKGLEDIEGRSKEDFGEKLEKYDPKDSKGYGIKDKLNDKLKDVRTAIEKAKSRYLSDKLENYVELADTLDEPEPTTGRRIFGGGAGRERYNKVGDETKKGSPVVTPKDSKIEDALKSYKPETYGDKRLRSGNKEPLALLPEGKDRGGIIGVDKLEGYGGKLLDSGKHPIINVEYRVLDTDTKSLGSGKGPEALPETKGRVPALIDAGYTKMLVGPGEGYAALPKDESEALYPGAEYLRLGSGTEHLALTEGSSTAKLRKSYGIEAHGDKLLERSRINDISQYVPEHPGRGGAKEVEKKDLKLRKSYGFEAYTDTLLKHRGINDISQYAPERIGGPAVSGEDASKTIDEKYTTANAAGAAQYVKKLHGKQA